MLALNLYADAKRASPEQNCCSSFTWSSIPPIHCMIYWVLKLDRLDHARAMSSVCAWKWGISHQLATNMGNSLIQHVGQYVQPSNINHLWMRSMFRQTPMAPWPRPAAGLKDLLDIITLAMDIFQSWQQRLRCEIGPDFVVKGSTKNEQRIGKGIPILYCLISKKTFEDYRIWFIPYLFRTCQSRADTDAPGRCSWALGLSIPRSQSRKKGGKSPPTSGDGWSMSPRTLQGRPTHLRRTSGRKTWKDR